MIQGKHYLTKEGLKKLKNELEELTTDKRQDIADRLKEAASYGDLSENAEYKEAKEAQGFLEGRIKEVQIILANYEIIHKKKDTEIVVLGSHVKVQLKKTSALEVFVLVGPEEANPAERKISHESPLGKELMGKPKGSEVQIETPGGTVVYLLVDIL